MFVKGLAKWVLAEMCRAWQIWASLPKKSDERPEKHGQHAIERIGFTLNVSADRRGNSS